MRLSTRQHAVIDYVTGAFLIASPWLCGFADRHVAPNLALGAGAALLLLSSMTDYEFSILRFIPMNVHRAADLLFGIVVGAAPIHFAIGGLPGAIFVLAGVVEIAAALLTRPARESGQPIVPGAG